MKSSRKSMSVSVRRHFVDSFFNEHAAYFTDKEIIDIGGKKKNKRGLFDIDNFTKNVRYVNIDKTTEPDIISDATAIPLPESSCDVVILGEILEHVPDPRPVLKEAARLLRRGGHIVATVPFMYPVHADP